MRRPMIPLPALIGGLLFAGAPAEAAMRNYSVISFDRLIVTGPFDVQVKVGPGASVHAEGAQEAIDRLSVEQQGNTLVVKPLPGGWGGWPRGDHGHVTVSISTPALSQVSVTGSGDIAVDRVRGDALDLRLSGSGSLAIGTMDVIKLQAVSTGSGNMTLAGKSFSSNFLISGSGNLSAEGLAVQNAEVSLVGSGDVALDATVKAKVTLAGSGDLNITGPATCEATRSGSGTLTCAHRVSSVQDQP
jgi:hypothetical protein